MSTAGAWKRFHAWLGSHFDELKAEDIDRMTKVAAGELVGLPDNVTTGPCPTGMRVVQVVFRDDGDYVFAVQPVHLRPDETPIVTWLRSDGTSLCERAQAIVGVRSCPGLNDWAFCALEDDAWLLRFVEMTEDEIYLDTAPANSSFVVWQENGQTFAAVPVLGKPRGSVWFIPVTDPDEIHAAEDPHLIEDSDIVQIVDGKPFIKANEPENGVFPCQWGTKHFRISANQSVHVNGLWFDSQGQLNIVGREWTDELLCEFHAREDRQTDVQWRAEIKKLQVCGHGRLVQRNRDGDSWLEIVDALTWTTIPIERRMKLDRLQNILVVPAGFLLAFEIDHGDTVETAVMFVDREFHAHQNHIYFLGHHRRGAITRITDEGEVVVIGEDNKQFRYLKQNRPINAAHPAFTVIEHRLYGDPHTVQSVNGGFKSWHWVDGTFYLIHYPTP